MNNPGKQMDGNKPIHLMAKAISAPHLFIKKNLKIKPKSCAVQGKKRVLLLTSFFVKNLCFQTWAHFII
jgi:hypothetical protein